MLPPLARFLDPQPPGSRPVAESVNIPLDELSSRMHELPPRHGRVEVAGPEPLASSAVASLIDAGREATVAPDWRYGERQPARLWSPNAFVLEVAGQLEPGTALDLACGSGRDAVALACLGWQVSAIDHLPEALEMGRDLERRYAVGAPLIQWECADLESGPPAPGQFDLVAMSWYLNRDLIRLAVSLLNPGGSLLVETFTMTHRERFGKPRTEAFVLAPGELRQLAGPLEVVSYDEGWRQGRHSARLWARKAPPHCAE